MAWDPYNSDYLLKYTLVMSHAIESIQRSSHQLEFVLIYQRQLRIDRSDASYEH